MPKSKNAEHRFLILDRCLSDTRHKYTIDDLLEMVNDQLYDASGSKSTIMTRQLRSDLNAIRKMLPDDVYLDAVPFDGKKCYYRYSVEGFSIYKNELSVAEVQNLRSTIEMLSKYRGLPSNGWLEEIISNLEVRFGVKGNADNLVSFGQNEQLKGIEYLSEIIDATIHQQPLEIEYTSSNGNYYILYWLKDSPQTSDEINEMRILVLGKVKYENKNFEIEQDDKGNYHCGQCRLSYKVADKFMGQIVTLYDVTRNDSQSKDTYPYFAKFKVKNN